MLGDTVEGFKLSEIREKSVIFTKGASKVEVAIDFFRRVEETGPRPPIPLGPAVAPRAETRVAPERQAASKAPAKPEDAAKAEKTRKAPRTGRQLQPPQQPDRRPSQRAPSQEESAPVESR